jgi:ferric-dicitrate binding protein FerR (iron transport regulator)
MYSERDIHQIIIRILSGEANPEEKLAIAGWLEQKPENKALMNDLQEIWLSAGVERNADGFNVEEAIRRFRMKTLPQTKHISKSRLYRLMRYAAILLLVLLLPFSYYTGRRNASESDTYTTISCAQGDRTSVILPDSSRVYLNSGSRLIFNNNFQKGVRLVRLDGEAYFSVRKDPFNPFRVKTSDIDVEVLGTEFNLKAYPDEGTISATLVTGSIKVSDNRGTAILEPSQKMVFDKASHKMQIQNIADLSPETEWKNGRLVFRNQSLGELEQQLERWFDVEIKFADEYVKNRRFTGTLERESILEVISYIGRSKYVGYQIEDNVITFYTE